MIAQISGVDRSGSKGLTINSPGIARRALPAWLPAPPVARPNKSAPARQNRSLWLRVANDTLGERIMLLLLVASAVVAIAYGFSNLVDLVENWARINTSVGQLVH